MFTVYKHTTPNGKSYVGITSQKTYQRWNGGKGYKTQKKFYRAILKYGWSNIKHEVLYENLTEQEAYQKEKELINKYNSTDPKFGYNSSTGGELISLGVKHSANWKRKMSRFHKTHPNSGQFKKGVCPSTCFKKNHIPWNKGINSERRKQVVCIETNIVYESTVEAAKDNNTHCGNISRVCSGKLKSLYGLHYKYVNN